VTTGEGWLLGSGSSDPAGVLVWIEFPAGTEDC